MKRIFLMNIVLLVVFVLGLNIPSNAQNAENESSGKDLPIEAARTVHLNKNEGTWLSLDVHPNGQKIIFDYMGNLFELPIGGGDATQLTHGMGFDSQPQYSPNGNKVAFISDRNGGENIWILDLQTMQAEQRTEGKYYRMQGPTWSPDGKYIVAARADLRGGVHKLHLYHVDGGSGTEFIKTDEREKTIEPAFGSDGHYIWFSQRSGDWQY